MIAQNDTPFLIPAKQNTICAGIAAKTDPFSSSPDDRLINSDHWWNDIWSWKQEYSKKKNIPVSLFHHKFHTDHHGIEPGTSFSKADE